jgi:hypothetical protein
MLSSATSTGRTPSRSDDERLRQLRDDRLLLDSREKASRDAAGWHVYLDRLEGLLAGEDGPAALGASEDWRCLYEEYQRRGAPTGAAIPGE